MPRPRSELVVVVAAAATFGALLASYSALRPVREAIVAGREPEKIPWLFVGTLVVTLAVSSVWGRVIARGPRNVVAVTFHLFAASAFGFAMAIQTDLDPVLVGRVFYVWAALFGLFAVSVFWSLLADLVGPNSARRFYGPIAAGGSVGAILGPALTNELVDRIGVSGVLAMSAVLLELAVVGVVFVRRAGVELGHDGSADKAIAGRALDGIAHVARSPYLRTIVGYVLCTSCAATLVYVLQAHVVHDAHLTDVQRTKLYASIDVWMNIVAFALQLVVAGWLIKRLGPGIVLCVLPLVQAGCIALLAASPTLDAAKLARLIGPAATHGLTRPARELLFTVIGREDKYRAKNTIDTVALRFGDVSSSFLGEALKSALTGVVVGVAFVLAAGWIALATALGAGFRKRRGTTEP